MWAFTTTTESNWHPLTWLSLMLDATIDGANPRVFHATNLLLHIANTLLLFLLLERSTGYRWRSAFVAALFAVHPLHVESVAWVAERKDVLSTLFWLITIAAYARYAARPSPFRYAAVFASLALGLMAKPMLVTLPLVLLLLDFWPLQRWGKTFGTKETLGDGKPSNLPRKTLGAVKTLGTTSLLLEKVPLFALAAASCVTTLIAQRSAVQPLGSYPLGGRVSNALVSYVSYLWKMTWPHGLAVFYQYPRQAIPLWKPVAAAILIVTISVAAVRLARTRPWLPVGWFWYVVTLLPVIGLVQVGSQAMADRYTYVPLIGIFVIVAWESAALAGRLASASLVRRGGEEGPRRGWRKLAQQHAGRQVRTEPTSFAAAFPKDETRVHRSPAASKDETRAHASRLGALLLAASAVLLILALGICTWVQLGHWRNTVALFTHAVESTRENAVAHDLLAMALDRAGEPDLAIAHLREALRVAPGFADAHFELTRALLRRREIDEAADLCLEEQAAWPEDERTTVDLGMLAIVQGEYEEAADRFMEILRTNPDSVDAHLNLSFVRGRQGRVAEMVSHYAEVIRLIGPEGAQELSRRAAEAGRRVGHQ